MENSGRVVDIHLCVGHRKTMKRVEEVRALEGLGLEGDFHARGGRRQVLLIEEETLQALHLSPGDVRENIATQGISLMKQTAGHKIQIGDQVLLEITGPCDPCHRMEEIQEGLEEELKGRRGVLTRVIRSGFIRVGDTITVSEERVRGKFQNPRVRRSSPTEIFDSPKPVSR